MDQKAWTPDDLGRTTDHQRSTQDYDGETRDSCELPAPSCECRRRGQLLSRLVAEFHRAACQPQPPRLDPSPRTPRVTSEGRQEKYPEIRHPTQALPMVPSSAAPVSVRAVVDDLDQSPSQASVWIAPYRPELFSRKPLERRGLCDPAQPWRPPGSRRCDDQVGPHPDLLPARGLATRNQQRTLIAVEQLTLVCIPIQPPRRPMRSGPESCEDTRSVGAARSAPLL